MRHLSSLILWCLLPLVSAAADNPTYTISTFAGGTGCPDGGAATQSELGSPEGLAVDSVGNVYIADALDHRVRRVSPTGVIATVAGTGYPGFSGDGGPASNARLNAPYGLAVDRQNNLYIADLGNARIRKMAADGTIQTAAGAGVNGITFNQPRNVVVDADGNLYVSDFGAHRVLKISPDGTATTIAGIGAAGAMPDGATMRATTVALRAPAGLALDAFGSLYIADSGNHRVRKVVNGWISTVPSPEGALNTPTGIVLDASGNLYVAAKGSSAVFRLLPSFARIAGDGRTGFQGDGGLANRASLSAPREVAFDLTGSLLIADARPGPRYSIGVIRRVSGSGIIDSLAGGVSFRSPGDGGAPRCARLLAPAGLALDAAGNLYIADRDDHRIRRISNGVIDTVAGFGFPSEGGDGGLAVRAGLDLPSGIAVGPNGEFWIAELGSNRVRAVDTDGVISTLDVGALSTPTDVAVDAAGTLYIADSLNQSVRTFNPAVGAASLNAPFDLPTGVAVAPDGAVYVADASKGAIVEVTPSGAAITLGTGAIGTPTRVALDSMGNFYVSDTPHHRVWRLTPAGDATLIAGKGEAGYSGDDGPALEAALNEPDGLAVDSDGNVYIADRGNGVIRRLTPVAVVEPPPVIDPPPAEPPALNVTSLVNAASLLPGPIAAGEIVALFGSAFDPEHAQVRVGGEPAALLYASESQMNLLIPDSVAGRGSVELEVLTPAASLRLIVPVAASSPGLFPVALNQDGTVNSTSAPAAQASAVTLFATGEGKSLPLTVAVAGNPATVLSTRSVGGVLEMQVRIPESAPSGKQSVIFTAGPAASQAGVVIHLQ